MKAITETAGTSALRSWCDELRKSVVEEGSPFHERDLLAAKAFRETEGEPFRILRVAKTTSRILAEMPVRIREGEVLAGWHPNTRADEKMERDLDEAREYLKSCNYWVAASEGHMAPDYETIMKKGLGGIKSGIARFAKGLDPTDPQTPSKRAFYAAALTSIESLQNYILRYAKLAESQQSDDHPDEWKRELARIAEACSWISSEPPRNFREAIQLSWFVFLGVALEASSHHHCFGPGHIDRYLLPFYLEEDNTDLADALLEQLFLKCNEFTGPMMSAIIVGISGRNPDGSDATNELSHKCLEISDRARMYFPGLDIHWHRDIDDNFMRKACRLLRNGMGQPSFFNIDLIIEGLGRYGIPYEHAVEHLPSTCTETSIQGRTNPWVAWTYENIPMCLLLAMFGGRHPISGDMIGLKTEIPQSYAELNKAFHEQIEFTAHASIEKGNRDQMIESLYRPFPLLSCFIQDCLGRGVDISHGGAMYNLLQPEAVGISNAVDGLAAIKTLLDSNRYSLDDFRKAIVDNYEGHDEIRRTILEDCPKHGNNVPWVNDLFAEASGKWCSSIEGHTNFYGGPVMPGFLGWTVWIGYGNQTPATPDGRKAGMPLANCIGPCTGVALKGTPSMLMSTCGLDHSRGLGGIVFNVRFSPGSIAHEPGIERLKALIETAMDLGIFQMQINMVGSDQLREAQKDPENYADLLVRIGGYLVPFTQLPKDAQQDVIARTEMEI